MKVDCRIKNSMIVFLSYKLLLMMENFYVMIFLMFGHAHFFFRHSDLHLVKVLHK
jgi:hypothetical protein